MSALLDSITWWPWNAQRGPIRDVQREHEAPGLVTLTWRTDEPCPTRLQRPDGTELYADDRVRHQHQVTLSGWAGITEQIAIRAYDDQHLVDVTF